MDIVITPPEQDYQILKEKYNQLVDLCSSLQKENEKLKRQILPLKVSEKKKDDSQSYTTELSDNTFIAFFTEYIAIIKKALDSDAFISYTYASKNAKNYLKIEKNTFEQLIIENATIPLKTFKEYCGSFMLIKTENNKYTFTNDRQTVYYINKAILNCFAAYSTAPPIKENA